MNCDTRGYEFTSGWGLGSLSGVTARPPRLKTALKPRPSTHPDNIPQAPPPLASSGLLPGSPLQSCTSLAAFLHSAGTAPIITLFILGTPLKTTHLQKDA